MKVAVTGHRGFIGQWVVRALTRQQHDYRGVSVEWLSELQEFSAVIHLAKPRSDGIGTMLEHPFSFASDILSMDLRVIRACVEATPQPKLVCLGSVCAYPENAPIPTRESSIWNGYPEVVNAPYGIAKRTQLMLLQAARKEYGLTGIHLITANVYGPGDRSGHVIPATIRKMLKAKAEGADTVTVWGEPEVTRSFLYVEDAAEGIVRAMEDYDGLAPLNLAPREETTIAELAHRLQVMTGFSGRIVFDRSQPTEQKRRQYALGSLRSALLWEPETLLETGLRKTVEWVRTEKKETT